jgi:hypothetical protein
MGRPQDVRRRSVLLSFYGGYVFSDFRQRVFNQTGTTLSNSDGTLDKNYSSKNDIQLTVFFNTFVKSSNRAVLEGLKDVKTAGRVG